MIAMIIVAGAAAIVGFGLFVAGITRHDMRLIKLEKEFRQHPNARRWRTRPAISIVSETGMPAEEMKMLRKSYRKIRVVSSSTAVNEGLVLLLPPDTKIDPTTLPLAVRQLNSNNSPTYVELHSRLAPATSTTGLFQNYHRIVSHPFVSMRSGLGIESLSAHRPVLFALTPKTNSLTFAYILFGLLFACMHVFVFSYILYLAVALYEPELFLTYISAAAIWCVWTIITYPRLSLRRRMGYIILLPVPLTYFAYKLFFAPFQQLSRLYAALRRPQNAIIDI